MLATGRDRFTLDRFVVNEDTAKFNQEIIVVVHGLGASKSWMIPLCKKLAANGYRVENWGYRSFSRSIDYHAGRLREFVDSLPNDCAVHFVGHSMGAIVVRAALDLSPLNNLGRIVFLAPPNQGTPVARYASKIAGVFCRSICQLSDDSTSFVNRIRNSPPTEFGVVAARYDLLVPKNFTGLAGMTDHVTVDTLHSAMLFSERTASLALCFIETGRFEKHESIDSGSQATSDSVEVV
jgi:pimeloyl-ACP methyl ester carboxylesterase